jgi:phage-related protein
VKPIFNQVRRVECGASVSQVVSSIISHIRNIVYFIKEYIELINEEDLREVFLTISTLFQFITQFEETFLAVGFDK